MSLFRSRFFQVCVTLLLLAAACSGGYAPGRAEDGVLLGPLFSGLLDQAALLSIGNEYKELSYAYGRAYQAWPYQVKERISGRMLALPFLPEGIVLSRTPGYDDLGVLEVVQIAWEGMLDVYPLGEWEKAWYANSYTVAYGTQDGAEIYWWVLFSPSENTNNALEGYQPMTRYSVQVDRAGNVTGVAPLNSGDVAPTDSPLDSLFFHMQRMHGSDTPLRILSDEEKLDLNYLCLFPHLSAMTAVYGLPGPGDVPKAKAVSQAKGFLARIGAMDGAPPDDARTDASFLVGEPFHSAIRSAAAYPLWEIRFADSAGGFLYRVCVDAATGEIVEYSTDELGYIPVRW